MSQPTGETPGADVRRALAPHLRAVVAEHVHKLLSYEVTYLEEMTESGISVAEHIADYARAGSPYGRATVDRPEPCMLWISERAVGYHLAALASDLARGESAAAEARRILSGAPVDPRAQ